MKLSIITINKNNAFGLKKTILSVINQTFSDYEYIIIDGKSSDESINIIKENNSKINFWVSELDSGIYNAMNKGILKAQGEYCLFLNSGDYLISCDTLKTLFNEIDDNKSDIFYSNRINSDNSITKYPDNINLKFLVNSPINHQNSIIKRLLFIQHGLYNEDLRIASDWEFFLMEYYIYKSNFLKIKTNISVFDINGIGSRISNERLIENDKIIKNVFINCNEISDIIIEYRNNQDNVYFDIINKYGNSNLLTLLLKIYRKILFFVKIKNK